MNTLVLVLVVLCSVLYIRYNLKYQDTYEILQLSPSKLTPAILAERNPIVVQNAGDMEDIVKKAFKYTYLYKVKKKCDTPNNDKPLKVKARFVILMPSDPDVSNYQVEIINPKYKGDSYQSVVVKMKTDQALIIPVFWRYKTTEPTKCIFLHDMFSCFYQSVGS